MLVTGLHPVTAVGDPPPDEGEDAEVLRWLFDAHFHELCRVAYRYLSGFPEGIEDAREVVHDVFLQVWRNRGQVPLHRQLRTYLYTLVKHRAIDVFRHRSHAAQPHQWQEENGILSPEELVVSAETAARIAAAIDALAPRQREILGLRWRDYLSYGQIAARLGISEKTVGNHIQRAMQHLQRALQDLVEH